ncbi:response regulator [Ectothiorhodospiraceae bacterium BW-2]|nr:response regulator [Ectothiorhodospiraceae bacterium BW-2]
MADPQQQYDSSTLDWIKAEIAENLALARRVLEQLLEQQEAAENLQALQNCLHQVAGALQLVELQGIATYVAELEAFAARSELYLQDEALAELLMEGILLIPEYMEYIAQGRPDSLYALLSPLNQLRGVLGEPPLKRLDYFQPSLSVPVPEGFAGLLAGKETARQAATKLLKYLQAAVIALPQGEASKQLAVVMTVLQKLAPYLSHERMQRWLWIATAFVDGLQSQKIPLDEESLGGIQKIVEMVQLLSRQGESEQLPWATIDKLNYWLLWRVATTNSSYPLQSVAAEVYHAFALGGFWGANDAVATINSETRQALADDILGELTTIKERLDLCVRTGNREDEKLQSLLEQLQRMRAPLMIIEQSDAVNDLQQVCSLLQTLLEQGGGLELMMDAATLILQLEATLQGWSQHTSVAADETGGGELFSSSHNVVIQHAMEEARSELLKVRAQLSDYLEQGGQAELLTEALQQLDQLRGTLIMLNYSRLAKLIHACGLFVQRELIGADSLPPAARLDMFADAFMAAEYFLDAFVEKRVHPALILRVAETSFVALGIDLNSLEPLQLAVKASDELADEGEDEDEGESEDLAWIATDYAAPMADETVPGEEASTASQQPTEALEEEQGEEIDEEILEIFIDEAKTELESIATELPHWQQNPQNSDALGSIRRSFHTIKGSGRLVGATRLGEFAWAFEKLLNKILEGQLAPSATLFDMLEQALEALEQLIANFSQREPISVDYQLLQSFAHELVDGMGMPVAESVVDEPPAAVVVSRADPSAEDSAYDAELLAIYSAETDTHLDTLRQFIDDSQRRTIDEPVMRAIHTLNGSSRMAGIEAVPALMVPLEEVVRQMQLSGTDVSVAMRELLSDAIDYIFTVREQLLAGGDNYPSVTSLLQRLQQLSEGIGRVDGTHPEQGLVSVAEPVEECMMPEYSGDDAELIEIFLVEAEELIDASESALHQWAQNPQQLSWARELQRHLHTLKGGARLGGITPMGDLSHALESAFEAVVEGRLPSSRELFELLQLAHDRLVGMLQQVEQRQAVTVARAIIEQLQRLQRGETAVVEAAIVKDEETPPEPSVVEVAVTPSSQLPCHEVNYDDEDADLLEIFLEEAKELLDASDGTLHLWSEQPDNFELARILQRQLHTLKGGARLAGLSSMGELCYALEALFESAVLLTPPLLESLTLAQRRLTTMVEQLEAKQPVVVGDDLVPLFERLRCGESLRLVEREQGETIVATESAPSEPPTTAARDVAAAAAATPTPVSERATQDIVRVRADLLDNLVNFAGEMSIYRSRIEQQIGKFGGQLYEMEQTIERLREQLRKFDIETEAQIDAKGYRAEGEVESNSEFDPLEFDRFTTMQQLSRSMMESLADIQNIEDTMLGLSRDTETLLLQQSRVNSELQQSLVQTRMTPLADYASRLRRLVRQVASELGKKANLLIRGAEVEMDRHVVERIIAPLEHLLRNALAHGIESPEQRQQRGKTAEGEIAIMVEREGSEIVIHVRDDGSGIAIDKVRQKAVARGLIPVNAVLSDEEMLQFIFESGFSTASGVSQVAGRGVGMDVVNSEVRQLGGAIHLKSVADQGATFTIRLPLNLTVTRALLVEVGESVYALPLLSVRTIERIDNSDLLELLNEDKPIFEWVDGDYEMFHLTHLLGEMVHSIIENEGKQSLILVQSGEHKVAMMVDRLIGSREVVVKSLGLQLGALPKISGATIMGDGSVVLILDVPALIRHRTQLYEELQQRALHEAQEQHQRQQNIDPLVMVVDDSITVRKVTERMLKRQNIRCVTAKDGVDAIAVLDHTLPDVMLLDIEMPRMDGFELATHIRNNQRLRHIPIIMITSRSGDKHRNRAFEIGVNRYMTKPYAEADLLQAIQQQLLVEV